ncbi:hypothetical protein [Paenibacillus borealis]|uniref:hypothetical protein n=1 Tax=Paenibacillus borealis TaxID=160799 RepID=UPI0012FDF366|nr:hypothetical protein [Paenibacillus borealis]
MAITKPRLQIITQPSPCIYDVITGELGASGPTIIGEKIILKRVRSTTTFFFMRLLPKVEFDTDPEFVINLENKSAFSVVK